MRWRRPPVDAVKSAATKHGEIRGSVVCVGSSAEPYSSQLDYGWYGYCAACIGSVRDLGIHLDSDLSMRTHVTRTVSTCFAVLRQIRSIHQSFGGTVAHCVIGTVTFGLRRCDSNLPSCSSLRLTTVSSKCCGTTGLWLTQV